MKLSTEERERLATHQMVVMITAAVSIDEIERRNVKLTAMTDVVMPPQIGCFRCERELTDCLTTACTGEASPDLMPPRESR